MDMHPLSPPALALPAGASPGASIGSELLRGAVQATPVMLALIALGLVFGAQAAHRGLHLLEVPLMTGSNFAGGSEFAAIGLWASPPPLLLIVAITFLINSRHLVMSAALTPHIRHLPHWKILLGLFLMSDESWSLSYADAIRRAEAGHHHGFSPAFYAGCGGIVYLGWISSTLLGAALGPLLGNIQTYGVDMAFPAVFLVVLAGMWKGRRAALPWLVSLAVAAVTHLVAPGGWYVAAGTAAGIGTAFCQARSK